MAARTMYDAVDAATAPAAAETPRQRTPPAGSYPDARNAPSTGPGPHANAVGQVLRTAERVQGSVRATRQGVLAPVKRASHAVSLEIAGSFFALFAFSFGVAAWRFRNPGPGSAVPRVWFCSVLAAVFLYFAISSFLRARRLSQR